MHSEVLQFAFRSRSQAKPTLASQTITCPTPHLLPIAPEHSQGQTDNLALLTHNKKYNPQLLAPPTKFGTKPLYSPFHPSTLTASAKAPYTALPNPGFLLVPEAEATLFPDVPEADAAFVLPSASWNLTFTRSKGCMTRVATVPAPNPATA